jgi:propanol-preferring alcohol dehydrogenase
VYEVGSNATNFKVGDRIGIPWLHSACGACEFCTTGWETLCEKQHMTGYSTDGGMREYAIAHDDYAVKLPDNLSFEQAAPIMCAGVTTYKGIKEADVKPGQFLTIVGAAGGLGHLAVQYAKAMGLRVIAVDFGKEKIDYAKSLGAEHGIDVSAKGDKSVAEQVIEYTKGGSHGVLVLATQQSAYVSAVDSVRRKGTLVAVGIPSGAFPLPIFEIVVKRVTVRGSIVGTRQDMVEALDYAERGLVKCSVALSKLEEINEVFDRMKANKIEGRVVLTL